MIAANQRRIHADVSAPAQLGTSKISILLDMDDGRLIA